MDVRAASMDHVSDLLDRGVAPHVHGTESLIILRRPRPLHRQLNATPVTPSASCAATIWMRQCDSHLDCRGTAEALQAVADLDLEALAAIEPPRGYGRD